jgi:hypothetical protein
LSGIVGLFHPDGNSFESVGVVHFDEDAWAYACKKHFSSSQHFVFAALDVDLDEFRDGPV